MTTWSNGRACSPESRPCTRADEPGGHAAAGPAAVESTVADGVEHRLDPQVVTVGRIAGLIRTAVLGGLSFVGGVAGLLSADLTRGGVLLVLFGWLLFAVLLLVQGLAWPALRYRYASYRIDRDGIVIKDGVLWRSVHSIPLSRVQHTDVQQGPIDRAFGLANLIIHTAGTHNASTVLAGLDEKRAALVRDRLIGDAG